MNCFLVTYTIKIEIYAVDLEIDQDKHAHLLLLIQVKSAVPKVWVAKGLKMDSATMIQICQNELFLFIFQVLSIPSKTELLRHTHFIWLRLIKTELLHHKWFSENFNGSTATSRN